MHIVDVYSSYSDNLSVACISQAAFATQHSYILFNVVKFSSKIWACRCPVAAANRRCTGIQLHQGASLVHVNSMWSSSSARIKAPTNLKHINLDELVMPDEFPQHGRALLRAAINSCKSTARSRSPRPAGRVAYGFICFAFPCQLCSL